MEFRGIAAEAQSLSDTLHVTSLLPLTPFTVCAALSPSASLLARSLLLPSCLTTPFCVSPLPSFLPSLYSLPFLQVSNRGLNHLMDRLSSHRDPMLLKIIRNISAWTFEQQQVCTHTPTVRCHSECEVDVPSIPMQNLQCMILCDIISDT
jgi:hypothetical protein